MPNNTGQLILWRASSSQHDWNDGHFLRRFLTQAQALGLIGSATWQKQGINGRQETIAPTMACALLTRLSPPKTNEPPVAYLEIGGALPGAWTLRLSVSSGEDTSVPNMAWLFFERQLVKEQELKSAFLSVHTQVDTEYAFIHPYQHWIDFSDAAYQLPVTTGSMFKGVFWANYLGGSHLDAFDRERLSKLPSDQVHWQDGKKGFYFMPELSLDEVVTANGEARLLRLTSFFHSAIRPDSIWYKAR